MHFEEEFRQIYKKEKCKIDTKSQFCIYIKQFNEKVAKKFDKSMENKSMLAQKEIEN
ncbi:hypothetical protein [Mesomycoplasma ovipneumoniae]|uniref:hypothetical protein n=1 Tax=Mesomycoplasma ovipneumoniae TaxID=29562 RepID=UPI002963D7A6|nr:hypothetical protein [Mesomycoplasma ovipneumoniae]